jgi:glutamine synthetase adenylyltransferase
MDEKEREQLRKKRLELNRLAAIKSRKKKKSYIEELNGSLQKLAGENKQLWGECKGLKVSYALLRDAFTKAFEENATLRRHLGTVQQGLAELLKHTPPEKTKALAAVVAARPVLDQVPALLAAATALPNPSTIATAEAAAGSGGGGASNGSGG